jgi:hypothetical protein
MRSELAILRQPLQQQPYGHDDHLTSRMGQMFLVLLQSGSLVSLARLA